MPEEKKPLRIPHDVAAIRREIRRFLNTPVENGQKVGSARWGVYAFYDYDAEPIYVGQTCESLQSRVGRHLTNQRTDAVAMNVLDPFEVAEIELWPFWELQKRKSNDAEAKQMLRSAEYTVFQHVLSKSTFGAVLNEADIARTRSIRLPQSVRGRIIPEELYEQRKHPDVRIARRATTIAALARVISERSVSPGLRRTLLTQARRLENLAARRYEEIGGPVPIAHPDEDI